MLLESRSVYKLYKITPKYTSKYTYIRRPHSPRKRDIGLAMTKHFEAEIRVFFAGEHYSNYTIVIVGILVSVLQHSS